jgi:S1-C subfamily serine protease
LILRALLFATLLALPRGDAHQTLSVLHIKVVVVDAAQRVIPVPRHALLISDNPATATPRRVLTALDGTVNVRLPPGNYTVESDQPVAFEGKAYQWMQIVDIVAGQDATLELTAGNAELVAPNTSAAAPASRLEDDPSSLLAKWQASVVEIWTPTAHASGFVIDASGLIATNQRAIGTATSVEVQITRLDKVAAKVVVADRERDVAILRIDARTAAALPPVPLDCAATTQPPIAAGQEIIALQAPLAQEKGAITGDVSRVRARAIDSDLEPATGGAGGPVFIAGGSLVGITAAIDTVDRRRGESRIVRIGELCAAVARAQASINATAPPDGTRLPVDPARAVPVDVLKAIAERRVGALAPYQLSSSEFDIALMTPLQVYAGQGRPGQMFAPESRDFANWSDYVATLPSVLLMRVSPKFEEDFWAKVARGAASTQGVALPPIKRFKSGFSRLRAFCGDKELTPIHAFIIEQRISEKDTINEGLYAFDPAAFAPTCASVKLLLYPDKERDKPDTVVVDPKVTQQIWQDFAPYRALK